MENQNALDLNQTVQMILQFFKENNLASSFHALAQETNVTFGQTANKDDIFEHIRKGQWQIVLKHMQLLKVDVTVVIALYEQIIKELFLEREYDLAQSVIKEETNILSENPEVLQHLWDLSQIREPPHTFQTLFKNQPTLEAQREQLAQMVNQHLSHDEMKQNRLITLLSMGLIYESHENGTSQAIQKPQVQQYNKSERQDEKVSQFVQKIVSHKLFQGVFKCQTIAISHQGQYLVLGGQDGIIEVWNYENLTLDLSLPFQANELFMLHDKAILSMVFSKDDKILASGDAQGLIKVWKFSDGKRLKELDTQGGDTCGISSLLFTSNNAQLIAGCLDKTIRVYGLKSGNMMKQLRGHDSFIQSIQFMPQREQFLVASSEDGVINVWNLNEQDSKLQLAKTIETPAQRLKKELLLNNFQMNPFNNKEILICHRYRSAHLMNIETNQILQEYASNQSKEEEMVYASFSGDGNYVYAYSTTKNFYIFDKKTGKLVSLLLVPIDRVEEINGMVVSASNYNESLVLYSLTNMFKLDSQV